MNNSWPGKSQGKAAGSAPGKSADNPVTGTGGGQKQGGIDSEEHFPGPFQFPESQST